MASSESYASLFTGDDLDYAIAKSLGNKYRGNTTPGCHLVGDTTDTTVDLDRLLIPGKYTIYFYTNGPARFIYDGEDNEDEDTATEEQLNNRTAFSVRPIYLVIYTSGGDHLYQTIMVGARLYWRDMWSNEDINVVTGHIPWRSVDLGIEAAAIINNLEYDANGTANALSQRMGTALVDRINKLKIGNANLLNFTNGYFTYGDHYTDSATITQNMALYWNMTNGAIHTTTYDKIRDGDETFPTDNVIDITKFPIFDDIDSDIISMFKSTAANAVFASYTTSSVGKEYNKIYVSSNAQYTASVYLVFDTAFLSMDNTNKAFITLSLNDTAVKTTEITLNRLGTTAYSPDGGVPYNFNKILEGTDYDYDPSQLEPGESGWRSTYDGPFKKIEKAASEMGYYRLTVTVNPDELNVSNLSDIKVSFGFIGDAAKGIFTLPKVEYGEFATQYNHSWGDLFYYFTNCESFFGVPINILHPSEFEDQDSFVYNINNHMFEAEPVAIGGGGGFVVHDRDDLNVETAADNTRRYDGTSDNRNNPNRIPIAYKPDGTTVINAHDNINVDANGYALAGYQELYTAEHLEHYYPRYKQVLFLNKQTNELLYWDDLCNKNNTDGYAKDGTYRNDGGFVSLNRPFVIRQINPLGDGPKPVDYTTDQSYTESHVGTNQFWLHKPSSTGQTATSKAATIKYYDPNEEMWLTAKADAANIYTVQPTAPGAEWLGKFWINSVTNAPYYSIMTNEGIKWLPLMAVWGANPTTTPTT